MDGCKTGVSGGQAGNNDWCELLERNYIRLNFAFGGITGRGSAFLKMCVWNAAYPWS